MLNKKVLLAILLVILMSATVLIGCTPSKRVNENARGEANKDELVLAIGSEPEGGFDPTTGWGRYGSPLFQSTLLKRDHELKIVKDLAEEYEVGEDGLTWTVRLREDVKFSDGKPLTAEDVVYTYSETAKSGSVIDLNILGRVEALEDYTVKFTLKQPQSTFINLLLTLGIVPKHAHGQHYSENPIGSGPFKLIQWDKGQQIIVEANPEYYGPTPAFKKLTFLFLGEDAAFAAAKSGIVDMAYVPPAFGRQEVKGMSLVSLKSVDNRGIMFPVVRAGEKTKDDLLVGNDVTADVAIRKAINVAVDRQALVRGVLEGFGTPAYTLCDGLPWWNSETVIKDANLEEAKKILSDAGWKDKDGDGILEKDSLKAQFTLVYPASDQTRQSLAIAVADMIKPIGINIVVEGKSWDDIERMMHSNAIMFGWGSHDPLEMYNLYSSKTAGEGWYNTGFYGNETVDKYMEKALLARTEEEALEYWKKAQWDGSTGFSARGDAPWAWLVNLNHLYLVNEKLNIGEVKIQPHGHGWPITDNIVDWRWKE
jgi:peptide/nickel transport system substrate-binding protein